MSHFLAGQHGQTRLNRRYACVKVEVIKLRPPIVRVLPEVLMLKPDALLLPLPADVAVVAPDGEAVPASGRFYITAESIDPYHLLIDWLESQNGERL
jgi:hypothetical protein